MKMPFWNWLSWKWQQALCFMGFHTSEHSMWLEIDDDEKGNTSDLWATDRCIYCAKKMI